MIGTNHVIWGYPQPHLFRASDYGAKMKKKSVVEKIAVVRKNQTTTIENLVHKLAMHGNAHPEIFITALRNANVITIHGNLTDFFKAFCAPEPKPGAEEVLESLMDYFARIQVKRRTALRKRFYSEELTESQRKQDALERKE